MIIGAGSGNDVSAALASGASHVDAVEIEPVLNELGRRDHPNQPYSDPRVSIHLDDGRSYLRRSGQKYDLIAYAVVDSLVLHSGYSNLRLESFLFTEQAFGDVKAHLGDDGVFVMYNYYRQGWVVGRLVEMAKKVFGAEPIVVSIPYMPSLKASDSLKVGKFTFIIAGKPGSRALESIRKNLDEHKSFWVSRRPLDNRAINGYRPIPPEVAGVPSKNWLKIGTAAVDTNGIGPLPTDDWPFLYTREASIPGLTLRGMALVAVLSVIILFAFAPVRAAPPNARMFFLGGLHAAGNQGRGPHGIAVRVDLGGQLDRVLRDAGDDPLEQFLRIGRKTTDSMALLPVPDRRFAGQHRRADEYLPESSWNGQDVGVVRGRFRSDFLRGGDLRDHVPREPSSRCRFRVEHLWSDTRRNNRELFTVAGLRPPAPDRRRLLLALGHARTDLRAANVDESAGPEPRVRRELVRLHAQLTALAAWVG